MFRELEIRVRSPVKRYRRRAALPAFSFAPLCKVSHSLSLFLSAHSLQARPMAEIRAERTSRTNLKLKSNGAQLEAGGSIDRKIFLKRKVNYGDARSRLYIRFPERIKKANGSSPFHQAAARY